MFPGCRTDSEWRAGYGRPGDPAPGPDAAIPARRDVNATRSVHGRMLWSRADDLIRILEDRTIQFPIFPVVLGQGLLRQLLRLAVIFEDAQEEFYVLGFEKIEAKAEANHGSDHGDRLVCLPDFAGSRAPLPLDLLPPKLGPVPRLSRGVFPEVDSVTQPVEVSSAPAEALDLVHDPKSGGQPRSVVADHRPVIVVETSQSGNLEPGETVLDRMIVDRDRGPQYPKPGIQRIHHTLRGHDGRGPPSCRVRWSISAPRPNQPRDPPR